MSTLTAKMFKARVRAGLVAAMAVLVSTALPQAGVRVRETDRIETIDGRTIDCYVNWVLDDHIEYTPLLAPERFRLIDRDSVNRVVFHDGREMNFTVRLYLGGGDILSGRLLGPGGDTLHVRTRYGLLTLPRSSVTRLEPLGGLGEDQMVHGAPETLTVVTVPAPPDTSAPGTLRSTATAPPEPVTAAPAMATAPEPLMPKTPGPLTVMEPKPAPQPGQPESAGAAVAEQGEEDNGTIAGFVYSFQDLSSPNREDGGAEVTVYRQSVEVGRTVADAKGAYSFSLPAGTYRLVCRFHRHEGSKGASGVTVAAGERAEVDFVFTYLDLNADKYRGKGVWTLGESKDVGTGEITSLDAVP